MFGGALLPAWPRGVRLRLRNLGFGQQQRQLTLAHAILEGPPATKDHPKRTALVMHGMLGNKANLRSFSRNLVREAPGWRFVLIDQRGHGDSAVLPGDGRDNTVRSAAEDVLETLEALGTGASGESGGGPLKLILGHSFGGKVAVEASCILTGVRNGEAESAAHKRFAGLRGGGGAGGGSSSGVGVSVSDGDDTNEAAPLHTWVLDSQLGMVSEDISNPESVSCVINTVAAVPMPVASKDVLVEGLVTLSLPPPPDLLYLSKAHSLNSPLSSSI